MYNAVIEAAEPEKLKQLPDPRGYKILIAMPTIEEKTAGGVYRPEQFRKVEETAAIVGFVLKLGSECYADPNKFPNGPWCKEGDWVMFRSYSGIRFRVHGHEFRLIDDDGVNAVVDDPSGYSRA